MRSIPCCPLPSLGSSVGFDGVAVLLSCFQPAVSLSVNPYLEEIQANLPRLLSLFDLDPTSSSYGFGDRYHWAWGLIDFPNATFQGATHGLARLWRAGLWPYPTPREGFHQRLDALIMATSRIRRNDGSLEEAFPFEGSYCVTALVAFDLLCTVDLLEPEISPDVRQRWLAVIEPLIVYLIVADETHALISNHLATAVAALCRWHHCTGDAAAERKALRLLERILQHQSPEGWFREYEGADPGYQSLCTYYLADVHRNRPDWRLAEPLTRSIRFLQYFAHPDGSFGGLYGSRATRFYYPAGLLALAEEIPEALSLARFMERSIAERRTVTLSAMDEPNLVPMFNAYAWSAALYQPPPPTTLAPLPSRHSEPLRCHFVEAGLLIDRGPRHYTIINGHKGGVVYHFVDHRLSLLDAGVVVRQPSGRLASSQAFNRHNVVEVSEDAFAVTTRLTAMPKQLPGPFQFLVLRVMALTVFQVRSLREWIKKMLVRMLITRQEHARSSNERWIRFGADLQITDQLRLGPGEVSLAQPGPFVPIHMASQGYWQSQDELAS